MSRISTLASHQSALANILRAQRELADTQQQYATGKRTNDLKTIASDAQTLAATRAVLARESSYTDAAKRVDGRLEAQALAIGEISDVADELRSSITEAIGLEDGRALMANLEALVARASGALNVEFGGTYLFAGGKDEPPMTAGSLSQLAAAGTADEVFDNGNIRAVAQLREGRPDQIGLLADEIGGDLVASIKRIKDFADANGGGFSEPLTEAERDFLTSEIANVKQAQSTITEQEALNGVSQQRVATALTQSEARQATLEALVGDIEDADMAEVATRLQQTQLALQASAQAFTTLSRNSLLNYLS